MTNIRDYFKKKKELKDSNEESLGKKILKHRIVIIYRTILLIAVIAAAVVVVMVQMKNRVFDSYQVISTIKKENIANASSKALGENILIYSSDGASCLNRKGEVLWNQTFEMQKPLIDTCQDVAAMGDYNGSTIYVMDSQGPIGEIDTKMPIRSFAVSENGMVAAVLDDTDITWIYLFDSSGKTIAYFKTTMKQSGYPVCVVISSNGNLVGVSYLYVDSGTMKSSVAFYNFGPVGQNEIDNFVSSYDYVDTVVPFLKFINNKKAVAVGDNRLTVYEGNQKPVSIADVILDQEIENIYYGSNEVILVYNDVTGKALYKADIYNEAGKLIETIPLNMEFSDILVFKDKIIVYNEQECLIHTVNGLDNFKGQFKKPVKTLIPTESSYEFVVVTSDSIETIELK